MNEFKKNQPDVLKPATPDKLNELKGDLNTALSNLLNNTDLSKISLDTPLTLDELASLFNWPSEQKEILPFLLSKIFPLGINHNPFNQINDGDTKKLLMQIRQKFLHGKLAFHLEMQKPGSDDAENTIPNTLTDMEKSPKTFYFSKESWKKLN